MLDSCAVYLPLLKLMFVVVGAGGVAVIMSLIGYLLLRKPETLFRILLHVNVDSNSAKRYVTSLRSSIGGLRVVGAICLAWGVFIISIIVRMLITHHER